MPPRQSVPPHVTPSIVDTPSLDGSSPATLCLQGVVDLFSVSALRDGAVRELANGGPLVVDCKELERIDASVLQLLLAIERDAREQGAALVLRDVPEAVSRYLDIAGADVLLARITRAPAPSAAPESPVEPSALDDRGSVIESSAPPAAVAPPSTALPEDQTS